MLRPVNSLIEQLFIRQDLAPRAPASADTMTFGRASSIRAATLCEAKPPNTTEWIAPMRAQASSVMCASAIIGMYTNTRSPRCTPSDSRIAAVTLTSSYS